MPKPLTPTQASFFSLEVSTHRAYMAGLELATDIYRFLAQRMAMTQHAAIFDQLQRSSDSVPSNYAEGHGRRTAGYMIAFVGTAVGSLQEARCQLQLLTHRLGEDKPVLEAFIERCDELLGKLENVRKVMVEI